MTEETAALYVVPTPLGNLSDLTRRAAEVLCAVPWVAAEDTRHSAPLLKQVGSSARLLAAHEHNEQAAAEQVIAKLAAGEAVARDHVGGQQADDRGERRGDRGDLERREQAVPGGSAEDRGGAQPDVP